MKVCPGSDPDLLLFNPPSYQSGIGVLAIRMIARIAPTNAAAPMTANTFLPNFFFAALQISVAQATQQPQVQCPAFPITKIVHIRFSCDHHLLFVKLEFIYLHNQSKSFYNYCNDKLHNAGFRLNLYSSPDRPIF